MPLEPSVFESVRLDSMRRCSASPPDPAPAFRGIVIAAPSVITRERDGRMPPIPLCGLTQLEVDPNVGPRRKIMTVRHVDTGGEFRAVLAPGVAAPIVQSRALAPAYVTPGCVTIRFFNYDVCSFVPIERAGTYELIVTLAEFVSNRVRFEVQP